MTRFALLSAVLFTLACAGVGEAPPVEPSWLPGVDLVGIDAKAGPNDAVLQHVPLADVEARLERAGWRRWHRSWDEGRPHLFQSRWSRVMPDGERWVDLSGWTDDRPDSWVLARLATGPEPRPVPQAAFPLPHRMTGDLAGHLVRAPLCHADELGGTIDLDLEDDGTFTWDGGGTRQSYRDGRWELDAEDLRLSGELGGKPHTTVCRDVELLGTGKHVQVLRCRDSFTFYCSLEPGPVVYVMDGGAGDEAVATVVAALQREDWPTIRTTRRREGPTNSYAFVMKHAENPRSMVEVLFRNDEAQAERYAYRLHRDLVLDGVEVRAWADAPAPFVVVVGGSVARR